jgi:hypothetical protein
MNHRRTAFISCADQNGKSDNGFGTGSRVRSVLGCAARIRDECEGSNNSEKTPRSGIFPIDPPETSQDFRSESGVMSDPTSRTVSPQIGLNDQKRYLIGRRIHGAIN